MLVATIPQADNYELLNRVYGSYALATQTGYKADIKQFETFINRPALDATPQELLTYWTHLKKSYKNNSVNRKIKTLSSLYSKAQELRITNNNPVKVLKAMGQLKEGKAPAVQSVNLTIADIKEALGLCRDNRLKLIVKTLATTGLRISECINIRLEDIQAAGTDVSVLIRGKGNKERVILLPFWLYADILETFNPQEGHIFKNSNGTAYKPACLYTQIKRLFAKTGRTVHPHLFRHFYATNRIKETGDIKAVSRYLGHSSTRITLDYYMDSQLTRDNAFINFN